MFTSSEVKCLEKQGCKYLYGVILYPGNVIHGLGLSG